MSREKKDTEQKMVDWYSPVQLLDTAGKTALSTIIGEYADPRLGTARAGKGKFFDYSAQIIASDNDFKPDEKKGREEIWIDYVADVGDGWNPTYAVGYNLAQPEIEVDINGKKKSLPRGEILILGGDSVYPTASPDEYEKRLIRPYSMAFKAGRTNHSVVPEQETVNLKENPHIFALPGNHDWYDSLVAFKKIFCSHLFNERKFATDLKSGLGGWRTRQKRSYFTLKLPHKWWLLGVDLQLSHNIDVSQLQYFESIVNEMQPGDKVILCVPEPYWVKAIKYQGITDKFVEKEESIRELEEFFERRGVEIKVYIAGDLHHYRRFQSGIGKSAVHRITAGGGGAFLHPTHDFSFKTRDSAPLTPAVKEGDGPNDQQPEMEKDKEGKWIYLEKSYPEPPDSRKFDRQNLWFFTKNKSFGFVTAVVYLILAWFVYGGIEDRPTWTKDFIAAFGNLFAGSASILSTLWTLLEIFISSTISMTWARLIREPIAALIIILMLLGLIFFTDSNDKWYRRIAGFIHGVTHLAAAFLIGWSSYLLGVILLEGFQIKGQYCASFLCIPNAFWVWLLCIAVFLVLGYFIGATIMGLYLYISLHWFGRHDNEAFSALKIEDCKNFLRMKIDKEGSLTIYPVKLEKVPRDWEPVGEKENPDYFKPIGGSSPELIEVIDPIR